MDVEKQSKLPASYQQVKRGVNMFGVRGNRVFCEDCNLPAVKKKEYEEEQHQDDPEYFYEPWDNSDLFLFVCRKCKREDFLS